MAIHFVSKDFIETPPCGIGLRLIHDFSGKNQKLSNFEKMLENVYGNLNYTISPTVADGVCEISKKQGAGYEIRISATPIKTSNRISSKLLSWYDLTEKEKEQCCEDEDNCGALFFRRGGDLYSISEFVRIDKNALRFQNWHAMMHITCDYGIVIKIDSDSEKVVHAVF